jgi:hypothetical protein
MTLVCVTNYGEFAQLIEANASVPARFDEDLRSITVPKLSYICIFGDLSVRAIMSILSLAPPALEELVFHCGTGPAQCWINDRSVSAIWQELSRSKYSGLKKLVFRLWGVPTTIKEAVRTIRENLLLKEDILEFPSGEFSEDDSGFLLVKPLHQDMLL